MNFIFMGCGGDGDGGSGFVALRYKDTLFNILISFFSDPHKEILDISGN